MFGYRIIFDKQKGTVINDYINAEGYIPISHRPKEIDFLDLPYDYNENNFKEAIEYHIDVTKDKETTDLKDLIVIDKYKEHTETEEEKLKKELLKTQAEVVNLKYKEVLNNKNLNEKEGK
ncbi:hypothetical protein [Clostridium botulinum]|uniref:hypothetical protein n=1 Tax=Clostridium botulinum TaxID=1491 RepID=UPI0024914306|nr:hypothetical protein [Clostridium botulinum]BDB01700.1 hypothetical protein CBOS2020_17740 [Clostridium botulinum]